MTALCTQTDVLARPAMHQANITVDNITDLQIANITGYIEEASILVEGYLNHTFDDAPEPPAINPDPVPDAARVVTARVVARAMTSAPVDPNFDQYSSGMGPFQHTKHVSQDVLGGGVWLTHQDKMALDSIEFAERISHVSIGHPARTVIGTVGALRLPPSERWRYFGQGYDA